MCLLVCIKRARAVIATAQIGYLISTQSKTNEATWRIWIRLAFQYDYKQILRLKDLIGGCDFHGKHL